MYRVDYHRIVGPVGRRGPDGVGRPNCPVDDGTHGEDQTDYDDSCRAIGLVAGLVADCRRIDAWSIRTSGAEGRARSGVDNRQLQLIVARAGTVTALVP